MPEEVVLARWIALKQGDGLERSRRAARNLSLGAFLLSLGIGVGVFFWKDFSSLIFVLPATIVGWMLAERNALETRAKMWPIFSRYLDWSRVEANLQTPRG